VFVEGEIAMKKLLIVLTVLSVLLMSVVPALAQTDVVTKAQITGAGGEPVVLAKWEGPDDDANKDGVQIVPNPAGPLPGQGGDTDVYVYAVVTDPNGINDIADVFAEIYHPDGTYKLQIHLKPVPCDQALQMFRAARAAGLIFPCNNGFTLDEMEWMLDCQKMQAQLWYGKWVYKIHQPDGLYGTVVTAVDTDGGTNSCANSVTEIISIVQLGLDFTEVDWGQIKPSVAKWVAGDDNFVPGDGKPTVWNQGNNLASLKVHNDPLVGANFGKQIIDFDVKLLGQTEHYQASQWVKLVGPLVPCHPVQIEFSVHAPFGLPKDDYQGLISIEIIHH
jgi:hypothetical protein